MPGSSDLIRQSIIRDMAEGVMTIGLNGHITYVNPAAEIILGGKEAGFIGKPLAACFFEYEENDAFTQTILDAVYDADSAHERIVPFFTGTETRQLHLRTSYLRDGEERIAVIAVLSDITELAELRDAVKAMEKIRSLNTRLELRNKLLSETFGRFLSDEIVRQLLDTPDGLALGGKKRHLTVLMSDLRGFTALSERMPAQDLLTMLNHYLGEMTEIIQGCGGTIIEFIGDGIMALFGAPTPSDCHARQAVTAAVKMQARMKEINEWNRQQGFPLLEMGIGVHTGDMIVGNIGSEKRTKYGVTGSSVNLCGRIESYTVGGQVLASEFTRAEITCPLSVADTMQVKPKGTEKPVTLYAVDGIGGPEGPSCRREVEPARPLPGALDALFYSISDKHIGAEALRGRFTALSRDEALLETDEELALYENLQFDIGGRLFAKVVEAGEHRFRLHFTSRPAGFADWLKAAQG